MKTQTRVKIVDFVAKSERATAKSIIEHVELTPPAVFRQLKQLLDTGVLKKQGKPPKVFYSVVQSSFINKTYVFEPEAERVIETAPSSYKTHQDHEGENTDYRPTKNTQ